MYKRDLILRNSFSLTSEFDQIEKLSSAENGQQDDSSERNSDKMHIAAIKKNPDASNNLHVYFEYNDHVVQVAINARKQK